MCSLYVCEIYSNLRVVEMGFITFQIRLPPSPEKETSDRDEPWRYGFRIPPVGWVFCCHSVCNRQEVGIIIIKYSPLVGYVALCGMPTHIAL
ncbi:hypothetical protein L1987_41261 [Smallanthus sonchifolius]|uniref:Uncharacterized protein n=1 Tax=Smallanthus sonchifolius TaxID=185202 RepID=A0ACB9GVF7_9ASTR|nr:hypothetical protein L1987_41261 [Smallanthus sonchifolius]